MKTVKKPLYFPSDAIITEFSETRNLTESIINYAIPYPHETGTTEEYISNISWIDSKSSCSEASYSVYLLIAMEKRKTPILPPANCYCRFSFELHSAITYSNDYLCGFTELMTPPGYPMPSDEVEKIIFNDVSVGSGSKICGSEILLETHSLGIKESPKEDLLRIEDYIPLRMDILADDLIIDVNYISKELVFEDLFGYKYDPNKNNTLTSLEIIPDEINRLYKTMCPVLVAVDNLIDTILRN